VSQRSLVILSFVVVYIVWGSTFLAIRISVETVPPLLVGGFRHFFGGILLLLLLRLTGKRIERRGIFQAMFVGLLTAGISNGSLIVVEKTVPSGIAAIAFTTMPLVMLLLNWISFERVRPSMTDFIVIPLGILGTSLVLSAGESFSGRSLNLFEVALLITCPVFWAIGSLVGRKIEMPKSILVSSAFQMVGGGTLLFLLGTFKGDWEQLGGGATSQASVNGVIYLTIVGSLIGYSAFAYLIKHVDSRLAGTYAFVNPVVAMILGYFWGEKVFSPQILLGAALAIFSVAAVFIGRFVRANGIYFVRQGK
jgi:drug/metabolite transporter (DMT)-like permease